jgi:hypothetical protein
LPSPTSPSPILKRPVRMVLFEFTN